MLDLIGLVVAVSVAIFGYRYAVKKQQARSLDGHTLKQLETAGVDLQQTHKLEFWFFGDKKAAIDTVAAELQTRQFEVYVTETDDAPRYIIRAIKVMSPELAVLQGLRMEFLQLGKAYGVEYDGWDRIYNQ
ncbi:MAG TPA: ribonuclease E inhibitor RraB [Gammaproteobacteria bacterium]